MNASKLLRTLRGDRTQAWLAGRLGLSQSQVCKIERGLHGLSIDVIGALRRRFGGELDRLTISDTDLLAMASGRTIRRRRKLRAAERGAGAAA